MWPFMKGGQGFKYLPSVHTETQDQSACVLCPKTCCGISDEVSIDVEAGEEESTKFRLKRKRHADGIKAPEKVCCSRGSSLPSHLS